MKKRHERVLDAVLDPMLEATGKWPRWLRLVLFVPVGVILAAILGTVLQEPWPVVIRVKGQKIEIPYRDLVPFDDMERLVTEKRRQVASQ